MDKYLYSLSKYNKIIEITAGCGRRGQLNIDQAHEELKKAYNNLTSEDKKMTTLPKKHICDDDGVFGFASGMALTRW